MYANDTTFLVDSPTHASSCVCSFSEAAAVFGLRISWPNTKIQNIGSGPQPPSILVDGNPVDCLDLHISGKSTVIRWILPTRRSQADHSGLLSNVVFGLYLQGTLVRGAGTIFLFLGCSPPFLLPLLPSSPFPFHSPSYPVLYSSPSLPSISFPSHVNHQC